MKTGSEAIIINTGVTLKTALDASTQLANIGISTGVLHVPTVKPLDNESVLDHISGVRVVVSLEEHTIIGGLGSAVAELIAEADFDKPKRFKRIGLPDAFPDQYGSQDSLMDRYSLNVNHVAAVIKELAGAESHSQRPVFR